MRRDLERLKFLETRIGSTQVTSFKEARDYATRKRHFVRQIQKIKVKFFRLIYEQDGLSHYAEMYATDALAITRISVAVIGWDISSEPVI